MHAHVCRCKCALANYSYPTWVIVESYPYTYTGPVQSDMRDITACSLSGVVGRWWSCKPAHTQHIHVSSGQANLHLWVEEAAAETANPTAPVTQDNCDNTI